MLFVHTLQKKGDPKERHSEETGFFILGSEEIVPKMLPSPRNRKNKHLFKIDNVFCAKKNIPSTFAPDIAQNFVNSSATKNEKRVFLSSLY